jgi:hypothetical protein
LGTEGYLINLELREGKQHRQKNTSQFIRDTLNYARQITNQPIPMRLDSGNDSQDNFPDTRFENVDFIIKRNLRRESRQAWAELAKDVGEQRICRSGKSVWVGKTSVGIKGEKLPFPIVFEVTERRTKKGQELIFPEIEVDTTGAVCNRRSRVIPIARFPKQKNISSSNSHGHAGSDIHGRSLDTYR